MFAAPGISDPSAARDYLIVSSLRDALTMLASPSFSAAFHESAGQDDYRWGLLRRLCYASLKMSMAATFTVSM